MEVLTEVDVAEVAAAAHYVWALTDVSGIAVPHQARNLPAPTGWRARAPVVVSIDVSDIELSER